MTCSSASDVRVCPDWTTMAFNYSLCSTVQAFSRMSPDNAAKQSKYFINVLFRFFLILARYFASVDRRWNRTLCKYSNHRFHVLYHCFKPWTGGWYSIPTIYLLCMFALDLFCWVHLMFIIIKILSIIPNMKWHLIVGLQCIIIFMKS